MGSIPPKVALQHNYIDKGDAYSFAIAFWEMLALKRPHGKKMPLSLRDIFGKGASKQPHEDRVWNKPTKGSLQPALSPNANESSKMEHI
jgi:hypothetical protein